MNVAETLITVPQAKELEPVIGTLGKYHSWIAEADRIAVSPQVGTHPHQ